MKRIHEFIIKLFSRIDKRKRFVISAVIMTALMLSTTFFTIEQIVFFIPIIFLTAYFLTFFSILEDISKHEWIMLFIVPVYFSIVMYLFYFFIPQRWLTRLPIVLYSVSIYAILLSQNIFNVGVIKSLQLFRAAFSVNYLFLTICSFLSYSLILSLRMPFFLNFIMIFLATIPLALQLLWSVSPKEIIQKDIFSYAMLISLIIAEVGMVFSFVPLNEAIFALILTAVFYCLSGLFQIYLQDALFKERIKEYIFVLIFTSVIVILSISW